MLGEIITQTPSLSTSVKLYSFSGPTIHVRGGIYRGHSLRVYIQMTILPLSLIITIPLNQRGEVVLFAILGFILQLVLVNLSEEADFANSCFIFS